MREHSATQCIPVGLWRWFGHPQGSNMGCLRRHCNANRSRRLDFLRPKSVCSKNNLLCSAKRPDRPLISRASRSGTLYLSCGQISEKFYFAKVLPIFTIGEPTDEAYCLLYAQFLRAPLAPKAPAGLSFAGCPVVASADTFPAWDRTAEPRTASAPPPKLRPRPSGRRSNARPSPRRRKSVRSGMRGRWADASFGSTRPSVLRSGPGSRG